MSLRPIPAKFYTNTVDCSIKAYSEDIEGGDVETAVADVIGLACSVQSGVPIEAMDQSAMQSRANVLVYFPARPPVDLNDVITQTDVSPPLQLTVIDVQDVGGKGVIWCLPCSRVE